MDQSSHDSETSAIGQQVITTCAFIHRHVDGVPKVFLAKRAATKKFLPNVFELPGGHVEFGEVLVDALAREIREEFGMAVRIGEPFAAFTYTNDIKGSHSAEIVYFATFTDDIDAIQLHPEDHSAFGWYGADDLEQVYGSQKGEEDEEFKVVRRGLELLAGETIDLGDAPD